MSLLRAAIADHAIRDEDDRDAPSILAFLPSADALAATARNGRAFEREADDVEALRLARPLGAPTPQVEPKSIHSPSPPARVRWQPPVKRGTGPTKRFAER